MYFPRVSGILLHPTSLPSPFGIGDLGNQAYHFVDFLVTTGQHLWQILPLGPPGSGNSPYQCLSAFAGNPLLISPEILAEEGFLKPTDLESIPSFPDGRVDYETVSQFKELLLKKSFRAFQNNDQNQREAFDAFCRHNASWLDVYALFMALREAHNLKAWNTWESGIRKRQPEALADWRKELDSEILYHKYQQYQFFKQWSELKKYCNDRAIQLIGDIPMFVSFDSDTVWSRPDAFYLDSKGSPTVVAGVPPDYFSKTGQLWGNPLYRWEVMKQDNYDWWTERLKVTLRLVDIIRIDHFRGFASCWEVAAKHTTALKGHWVPGPGAGLFESMKKRLGALPIIAEDLGTITPEVDDLREQLAFPGMRVLQFAFSGDGSRRHKPHNYPRNCVVYTGTHDNNTTIGWFSEEKKKVVRETLKYLGSDGHEINWDFIRLAMMSVADTVIIPLQDVLGLGSEARMNYPGSAMGNWRWRFTPEMLTDKIKGRLKEVTGLYER